MIIASHVFIAIASIGYSLLVFFAPSRRRLIVSYALIAATVVSGTLLVLQQSGHMLETCVTGLLFVGVSVATAAGASRKLAARHVRTD